MKKILFSFVIIWGLFTYANKANAQLLSDIEGMRPYKLGVTVGYNASKFSASNMEYMSGFNIGVDFMMDASELINNTYLRADLLLQRKGSEFCLRYLSDKFDSDELLKYARAKAHVCYLELPISYGYAYKLNNDWTLLGETGPYFALGLGGHYDSKNFNPISDSKFFNANIVYTNNRVIIHKPKRTDIGWGFAVGGMLWSQHQIKVGYQFGFLNLNDELLQNRNLMINYTYFFE